MIGVFGGTGNTGSQIAADFKAKDADTNCIARPPNAGETSWVEEPSRHAAIPWPNGSPEPWTILLDN